MVGVLVNGKPYVSAKAPLRELGVLLEAKAGHPGRTAVSRLLALARTHGIAVALLGDPAVVMLDEPVNGLDPDRALWVRNRQAG